MMINDENKKSIKKMLGGKALYTSLGICLIAAGFVGYMAMKSPSPSNVKTPATTEKHTYVNISNKTEREETTLPKTNITVTEPTYEYVQTEPATEAVFDNNAPAVNETEPEKEKTFKTPLSSGIGTDYSMGIPVFSKTMSDYRTHNGVDFTGVKGENVFAICDGTVTAVTKDELWGNCVEIDHGNGLTSKTCGLADEALVSEGAYIYAGTVIGVVGNIPTEAKENDHIHLETRVNGVLADPLEILGLSE